MHHHVKFRQNRLNRSRDMAIFDFSRRQPPSCRVGISKFQFLTVGTVKRVELHHRAKFRQNRVNRGRDGVFFRFFNMAAATILDF